MPFGEIISEHFLAQQQVAVKYPIRSIVRPGKLDTSCG
jgi:hypothetical protein